MLRTFTLVYTSRTACHIVEVHIGYCQFLRLFWRGSTRCSSQLAHGNLRAARLLGRQHGRYHPYEPRLAPLVLCRHLFQPLLLGDLRLRVSQQDFEVAQGRDLRSRLGPPSRNLHCQAPDRRIFEQDFVHRIKFILGPRKSFWGPGSRARAKDEDQVEQQHLNGTHSARSNFIGARWTDQI